MSWHIKIKALLNECLTFSLSRKGGVIDLAVWIYRNDMSWFCYDIGYANSVHKDVIIVQQEAYMGGVSRPTLDSK